MIKIIAPSTCDIPIHFKVTVEKELSKSDKRLTDRLNILEAETDGGKGGKKKK